MIKRHGPPSQGWRTFLRNHAPDIAAMDRLVENPLLVLPLIGSANLALAQTTRDLCDVTGSVQNTEEHLACPA